MANRLTPSLALILAVLATVSAGSVPVVPTLAKTIVVELSSSQGAAPIHALPSWAFFSSASTGETTTLDGVLCSIVLAFASGFSGAGVAVHEGKPVLFHPETVRVVMVRGAADAWSVYVDRGGGDVDNFDGISPATMLEVLNDALSCGAILQ